MDRACYACGQTAPAPAYRCDCGEPHWPTVDSSDVDWPPERDGRASVWRFAPPVPGSSPGGVFDAAGGTPLVRTPSLDRAAGARVHVKLEGGNPTGSFKDRGTAVGVAGVLGDPAVSAVGTVSHGNMAASVAAYAAAASLPCVVCVPADVPDARLDRIARYDPSILRVEGAYGRLYEMSLAAGRERGVAFLNSDHPLRVAGQGTVAFEILAACEPDPPDALVLPVSSGGNASGVWWALRTLRAAGVLAAADVPSVCLVQAAACAPVARAFDRGDEAVAPLDPEAASETVAYSIANADPPSGTRALAAVRATDGAVVAVTDDEVLAARRRFAAAAGLQVETAAATTLAGAARLADRGVVGSDDDVVLVATGRGFGGADGDASASVDPDRVRLEAVPGVLDGIGRPETAAETDEDAADAA